jgi:hypothetical protein
MPLQTRAKNQNNHPGLVDIDEGKKPRKKRLTKAEKAEAEKEKAEAAVKKARDLDDLATLEAEQRRIDEERQVNAARPPSLLKPEVEPETTTSLAKRGGRGRARGRAGNQGVRGGQAAPNAPDLMEVDGVGEHTKPPSRGRGRGKGTQGRGRGGRGKRGGAGGHGGDGSRPTSPETMEVDKVGGDTEESLVSVQFLFQTPELLTFHNSSCLRWIASVKSLKVPLLPSIWMGKKIMTSSMMMSQFTANLPMKLRTYQRVSKWESQKILRRIRKVMKP